VGRNIHQDQEINSKYFNKFSRDHEPLSERYDKRNYKYEKYGGENPERPREFDKYQKHQYNNNYEKYEDGYKYDSFKSYEKFPKYEGGGYAKYQDNNYVTGGQGKYGYDQNEKYFDKGDYHNKGTGHYQKKVYNQVYDQNSLSNYPTPSNKANDDNIEVIVNTVDNGYSHRGGKYFKGNNSNNNFSVKDYVKPGGNYPRENTYQKGTNLSHPSHDKVYNKNDNYSKKQDNYDNMKFERGKNCNNNNPNSTEFQHRSDNTNSHYGNQSRYGNDMSSKKRELRGRFKGENFEDDLLVRPVFINSKLMNKDGDVKDEENKNKNIPISSMLNIPLNKIDEKIHTTKTQILEKQIQVNNNIQHATQIEIQKHTKTVDNVSTTPSQNTKKDISNSVNLSNQNTVPNPTPNMNYVTPNNPVNINMTMSMNLPQHSYPVQNVGYPPNMYHNYQNYYNMPMQTYPNPQIVNENTTHPYGNMMTNYYSTPDTSSYYNCQYNQNIPAMQIEKGNVSKEFGNLNLNAKEFVPRKKV
jgi:hypothetical protein